MSRKTITMSDITAHAAAPEIRAIRQKAELLNGLAQKELAELVEDLNFALLASGVADYAMLAALPSDPALFIKGAKKILDDAGILDYGHF